MGWLNRVASFVAGLVIVGVLAGIALKGPMLLEGMYGIVVKPPLNGTTFLFMVGLVLVFAIALPLAIADGMASRRFRNAEARLRRLRPDATVAPHDGPEGAGLRFESATGTVLLLAPTGGFGATRMVELPALVGATSDAGAETAEATEP